MKKVLLLPLILLVILLGGVYLIQPSLFDKILYYSYCDEPILYRVDTVDPRFNLSKEDFLSDISDASQIWDILEGKTLFAYDPKGDLSINLIYDQRQYLTNRITQIEKTVQSGKQTLKPQVEQFKQESAALNEKIVALNKEVQDWNNKGGASPEEFEKIIQRQKSLQQEKDRLNVQAKQLNLSADEYNSQVGELNQNINTFNNALEERPEEGIYKGPENKIEIYFNNDKPELIHTIAHELGHAIGIAGHVSNSKSIMYAKTSKTLTLTEEDISALKEVCKKRSTIEDTVKLFPSIFLQVFNQVIN